MVANTTRRDEFKDLRKRFIYAPYEIGSRSHKITAGIKQKLSIAVRLRGGWKPKIRNFQTF